MIKKIVDVKAACLRTRSLPVSKVDKKIKILVEDMIDTLKDQKDPEGVGLAAPQIGKNLQIFVVEYRNLRRVIINPEILEVSKSVKTPKTKKKNDILEGCLSLPHYYGPIKRPNTIKIKYLDKDGKEVVEIFKGFAAQIIQHEIDHLQGVLFVDRILEQNSPLYKFDGEDWEEVDLTF